MSKKNKKLSKSTGNVKTAPVEKPAKAPKVANPAAATRAKFSWKERAVQRVERAAALVSRVIKACSGGTPVPGVNLTVLEESHARLALTYTGLAALPDDFRPKRHQGTKSGVEVGTAIGILEERLADPIFQFLPAALFEGALVLREDSKQNWLVRCTDGAVRTIRKQLCEPVDTEDAVELEADDDVEVDGTEDEIEETDGTEE